MFRSWGGFERGGRILVLWLTQSKGAKIVRDESCPVGKLFIYNTQSGRSQPNETENFAS
jgi:hypothetical protein